MKNSRRIITLILALVMMVSTMSISTFAANFSDIADEKVDIAVSKLVANGIITGYEDGTFRPDNQITRAEFAAIVTRMKGVAGSLATDAVTGFADLDSDSSRAWARPYVKAAVDLGIINGFEDGTFRAGEPVTYEQAVKMLVCAVGYEVVAQSEYSTILITNPNATWSAGYISAAGKQGITKGVVTAKISEPASRGVVAVLTSNSLDVTPLVQKEDGSFIKDENAQAGLLTTTIEGFVSGNYYTGIDTPDSDAGVEPDQIKIKTAEGEEAYRLSPELAARKDVVELIGKGVIAYYDTSDEQLVDIRESNNDITTIDEEDIIRPISEGNIKYYSDGKKSTTINLSDYTVIYNGKYLPSDHEIVKNINANFTNGKIELIETRGRKFAKITSYKVYVADGSINASGKLSFKYGGGSYQFSSSSSDRPTIYVDGVKKDYSTSVIRNFNVINLMEAPEIGGNSLKKMYVTTKSYSGKVTTEFESARKVELSDKEYYLTNAYANYEGSDKPEFVISSNTYKYYLDYTGQIAAVDYRVESSDYKLGYIIYAEDDEVNLIKADKSIERVPMKDRVKLDGQNINKEEVEGKLISIAEALYGESVASQPVKYVIADGKLTAIDTAADKEGNRATKVGSNSDDTFVYNDGATVDISRESVTIGETLYRFTNKTVVVYVPENRESTAAYSIMDASKAFASGAKREIKVFGADPEERTKQPTLALIYGVDPAYDIIGSTPYMIVSNVKKSKEEIVGYVGGSKSETTLSISDEKFKAFEEDDAYVELNDVAEGDVIRFVKDTTGKVIAIEMIYDASQGKKLYSKGEKDYTLYSSYTSGDGELHVRYAEAFDLKEEDSMFRVTTAFGSDVSEVDKQSKDNEFTYSISSSTTIYRIEDGELITEENTEEKYANISISKEAPSEVIVITTSGTKEPLAKVIYIAK